MHLCVCCACMSALAADFSEASPLRSPEQHRPRPLPRPPPLPPPRSGAPLLCRPQPRPLPPPRSLLLYVDAFDGAVVRGGVVVPSQLAAGSLTLTAVCSSRTHAASSQCARRPPAHGPHPSPGSVSASSHTHVHTRTCVGRCAALPTRVACRPPCGTSRPRATVRARRRVRTRPPLPRRPPRGLPGGEASCRPRSSPPPPRRRVRWVHANASLPPRRGRREGGGGQWVRGGQARVVCHAQR
jgi:hypothetical protein